MWYCHQNHTKTFSKLYKKSLILILTQAAERLSGLFDFVEHNSSKIFIMNTQGEDTFCSFLLTDNYRFVNKFCFYRKSQNQMNRNKRDEMTETEKQINECLCVSKKSE